MRPLYSIHISENLHSLSITGLFSTLERLLPISFFFHESSGLDPAGRIILKDILNQNTMIDMENIPCLSVPLSVSRPDADHRRQIEVNFADNPDVPIPFRGRIVKTKMSNNGPFLSLRQDERTLATSPQGPIWSISQINGVKHFRSCLPLPHISTDESLSGVFNGSRFLELLPLIQFLREVGGTMVYNCPPLRATYIIDDPNLHWKKYGFVDYREIALHARRENYHVSFATIPLDMWFTHAATADLFRRNLTRLSLLVHGNNHAKEEMAGNYSLAKRKSLLQQAIQRIERLEKKTNLRVCRVMVPPHGACSNEMLAELPTCGFESACISAGSLRAHNREKSWVKTLGFLPSEVIEGCPVLPRTGLTGNVENALLLAAYLGQPLILRGHHQDLKDGVEVLDEYARFINGMGDVFWSNMTNLSRLNYLWRMAGKTYYVKLLGRKLIFRVPRDATEVVLEGFGIIDCSAWKASASDGCSWEILPGKKPLLSKVAGREILLECTTLREPEPAEIVLKPTSMRLIARRLMTEVRDRFSIF
jgi:hypothetical protein